MKLIQNFSLNHTTFKATYKPLYFVQKVHDAILSIRVKEQQRWQDYKGNSSQGQFIAALRTRRESSL